MRQFENFLVGMELFVLLVAPSGALAEEFVPTVEQSVSKIEQGWRGSTNVGGNVNFTHNRKFVGQHDGPAVNFGLNFYGTITYRDQTNDWRNHVTLLETFSYGPPIEALVKTADRLFLESTYYYHPVKLPWLGPFVRFVIDTTLFEGVDNRESPTAYQEIDGDGNVVEVLNDSTTKFKLTESGYPMALTEVVGVYAAPIEQKEVEVLFRLGFGSKQVFADNQFVLSGSSTANLVSVKRLHDYVQGGLEGGLTIQGELYKKKFAYKAYMNFMVPLLRTSEAGNDRSAGELTDIELGANMSFKLVEWASLDYVLRTLRQPQLIDDWQIQNMLLLTFSYKKSGRIDGVEEKEDKEAGLPVTDEKETSSAETRS